jgi:phenylalanyl-tRNA synthetase beta subunit
MPDWSEYTLGENSGDIVIDTSEDNQAAAIRLVSQGGRSLDIFSRDLEARVYDNMEFADAVRSLAIKTRDLHVRILVIDPDFIIKHGHRLVELARRLTSHMEIRKVHEDYCNNPESYLVVDSRGLLHRKLASRYEAVANFNNPMTATELRHHFTEMWERSKQYMDFKRLYI